MNKNECLRIFRQKNINNKKDLFNFSRKYHPDKNPQNYNSLNEKEKELVHKILQCFEFKNNINDKIKKTKSKTKSQNVVFNDMNQFVDENYFKSKKSKSKFNKSKSRTSVNEMRKIQLNGITYPEINKKKI